MDREQRLLLLKAGMELQQANMKLATQMMAFLKLINRKKERTMWVRTWLTLRPDQGAYGNLLHMLREHDIKGFKNFTRFTPAMFVDMVQRLTPRVRKQDTWLRKCLPVDIKVAITLRYLATGDSYKSLMYLFYVAHNTISLLVRDVCDAIYQEYGEEVICNPTTPEGWKELAQTYSGRWNFHHVLGALDGKHVRIKAPAKAGSTYYNYKGYNSLIMMALVDGQYKFRWVEVGAPGACSDAQIWNDSSLKAAIHAGTLGIPPPEPLPGDNVDMPYFVIGDAAFGLQTSLMKPFAAKPMTHEEKVFNYRLSRARRCVENAFGIMANRFRCFLTCMNQVPDTVESVMLAGICLHNLCRTHMPTDTPGDQEDLNHDLVPGAWRDDIPLGDMEVRLVGNAVYKAAVKQRQDLRDYYNGAAGSVPWQDRMV
jgi:hypothetical protein